MARFAWLFGLAVWVTLLGARPALADDAAARAHFKKGIELYDRKRYAEALVAFQDAYREKPSAGIKQNIALSLKGLGRLDEAATQLDEALDEGRDTLKPETRTAIERELAALSSSVATVRLIVESDAHRAVDGAAVTVTPSPEGKGKARAVTGAALHRPVRVMPGVYVLTARASGLADPPEKKLALESGAPIDVTFTFRGSGVGAAVVGEGSLEITTNVPDAVIRVEGVELPQRGTFRGKVAAGTRRVQISSPGWKTTTFDVTVTPGGAATQAVTLQAIAEAPPEYVAPKTVVPKQKRAYVAFAGALDVASYRLGVPLGEAVPHGERRNFGGLALGARFGYLVHKRLALEGLVELGGMRAKYKVLPADRDDSETGIVHWQLTPMLRFVGPGKVRFVAGTGFGVHGLGVETKLRGGAADVTKKGSGVGFSWLVDAGLQIDVGSVFLEFAAFLDVHGVGSVKDDAAPEGRLFYASPAARGGLRAGVGIPF